MAMRDFDRLQREAELLTPEEQVRLAEYLMARVKRSTSGTQVELSAFYGICRFPEDAMEYQKRVRSEWAS